MGDKVIITDDEDRPAPDTVVIVAKEEPKPEKDVVVTEKTTVTKRIDG
jgi:hypothetical protein